MALAAGQIDRNILKSKVRVPQHVVFRVFPAETVLLNLESGLYHGLNTTGGRMLEVLEQSATVGAAATQLKQEFNVEAERLETDLLGLVGALVERGLVVLDDAGAARP